MKLYVGITDYNWFQFLSARPEIDEVNFWQPGGNQRFKVLDVRGLFLFKLHAPRKYIVGGGFLAHSAILPISLAWESFREKNGVTSLAEMRKRTEQYRKKASTLEDYKVGCIILTQPFFFSENDWIPEPEDWSLGIQKGKSYDLLSEAGKNLWMQVQGRLQSKQNLPLELKIAEKGARYGEPILITPRLGQGSFRVIVTDAYYRRCAITQERTLPALEAVHIKPFSENGPHDVRNGVLLRADLHRLFDLGYTTISPNYRFEVSKRVKEEFDNGHEYYALDGKEINMPLRTEERPSAEFLSWHNKEIFKG